MMMPAEPSLIKHILAHASLAALEGAAYGLRLSGVDTSDRRELVATFERQEELTATSLLVWLPVSELVRLCEAAALPTLGGRSRLTGQLLSLEPLPQPEGSRPIPSHSEGLAQGGQQRPKPLRLSRPISKPAPSETELVQGPIVALDFETADYGRDSACSVAAVRIEGGRITRRESRLIRPPRQRFVFTRIHGITWSQVSREPPFGVVWRELSPILEGATLLVAHNASFDRSVLRASSEAAGLPVPDVPFRCTVKLARHLWELYPTKLPDVARYLKVELQHHDAASDTEVCALAVCRALSEQGQREKDVVSLWLRDALPRKRRPAPSN